MKYLLQTLILTFLQLAFTQSNATTADIDVVKNRVLKQAMQPVADNNVIEKLLTSIREDGTWSGIDYADVSREGFQHARHSSNMVILARAYKSKESKYHKKKEVKAAIEKALKNWVDHDYFCDNWWHNQIGTPNSLVTLMLLVGDELPKELVAKAQPIIGRAHLTASGARPSGDRIKIAGILAKNLLFIGDKEQFDQVIKVIENEIKFNTGQRGMQHDFSFHHRQDRVNNTLSYGLGYADAFAEWAAYVAGTEYAFSEEKIDQLVDYFLDGICKQMVYGRTDDPGTKNRDVSRRESGRPAGTATPERLLKSTDYRKSELEEIIRIRKGEAAASLSFGKFFWQTEHYSYQRPAYYTSVRMFSTRNRNMEEPYNSEGLKNHHKADGANYISITGEEYTNIAPVFDWQKIPGTTVLQKPELPAPREIQKDGLTDFVGAVTDGIYGAVGFDFRSPHDPLSAKKAWFFFDEEYVCLGAAIKAQSNLPVVTTLNQCLLQGDVTAGSNSQKSILERGDHQLEKVDWIFHDGIGYLFPKPVKVNVSNEAQTGSWYSINKQVDSPKEEVSLDVFKLWLEHGNRPENESYEYIVVPAVTEEQLENSPGREISVISNSIENQAVKHSGLQLCQAVFYKAGEVQVAAKLKVISDHPGIVMIKLDGDKVISLSVADPARNLGKYHLAISGKTDKQGDNFIASWDEESGLTRIAVDLPQGVYCGKSVTINL